MLQSTSISHNTVSGYEILATVRFPAINRLTWCLYPFVISPNTHVKM